jgi:hypothetical protein
VNSLRLAMRRSGAQLGLLATVGAVALVMTALVAGITGYLDFSATVNTRALLADVPATASSIRVETKLADDATTQARAADALFAKQFSGTPVEVTRTLSDFPLPATRGDAPITRTDGSDVRVTVASDAGLEANATLVSGAWPAASASDGTPESPYSGAMQADAAKAIGLAIGDAIAVGSGSDTKSITIVGMWRANDADSQRWFSDTGAATGNAVPAGDGTPSVGPLMVPESALPTFGPIPTVYWTIALDAKRATPEQLERFADTAANLRQHVIDDDRVGNGDILVSGTIAETAKTVHSSLESVRGVTPVGVLLVALIGLIALLQLARLLSLARRPENALLRSRGASAQWLTTAGVVEAAAVAVLGCGLGFAAAAGTLTWLYGPAAVPFAPWMFAVLAALALLVIFGTTAFLDSIRLAKRDAVDDSGRTRKAATMGTAVLAVAAAGVAVWQSLLYGSPLVTDASGRSSVNPLAVIAPTLSLIAIALVLLVAFGPLAAAWQRVAAARPRLQPSYSARQVARGLGSYAVAVLVVALAVGGLVVASGYSGTWRGLAESNAELVAGADARVVLTTSDFVPADATPETGGEFLSVPGVTAAVPVVSTAITIGDDDKGQLTAIPHDAIETIVTHAGGAVDPAAIARGVGNAELKGIRLPKATSSLSLSMTVKEGFGPDEARVGSHSGWIQGTLWLRNAAGAVVSLALHQVDLAPLDTADSATATAAVTVPPSSEPWHLVAIDYTTRANAGFINTTFGDVEATTPSGTEHVALDTRTWGMPLLSAFGSAAQTSADGLTLGLQSQSGGQFSLRYTEQGVDLATTTQPGNAGNWFFEPQPLPLVVSTGLATRYDVAPGDPLTLRFAGSGLSITGKVAAVVPLVPGPQVSSAVVVDLNALNTYILAASMVVPRANQVWLATDGPIDFSTALPQGASVVTPANAVDTTFAAPAELALWIAAIGCLLLAAISLGAVALTVARSRRGEVAVLRAVGVAASQQSRSRLAELSAVILVSALFGVLGGVAVSALLVPNLARSAVQSVSDGLHATLAFGLATGGGLFLASLAVMFGIAATSAARVRRAALDTSERLETR